MARRKAEVEEIHYGKYRLIVEPHECGHRVVLATGDGLYVGEHIGERDAAIEQVKAYVK